MLLAYNNCLAYINKLVIKYAIVYRADIVLLFLDDISINVKLIEYTFVLKLKSCKKLLTRHQQIWLSYTILTSFRTLQL